MRKTVAIVYSETISSPYQDVGEQDAENDILETVEAVHRALDELGYSVLRVPLLPPVAQMREKLTGLQAEVVFNLFEGFPGNPETEAALPEMLTQLGVPYTGSPSAALALALNKAKTNALLRSSGIPTPRQQLLSPRTVSSFHLAYPCIVKPFMEDGSHGLSPDSIVSDLPSLKRQVSMISKVFGGKALVEEFIEGREFNATALGNSDLVVLPVSEIDYSLLPTGMPKLLTFESKWNPKSEYFKYTKVICPAQIGDEERQQIADTALAAFRLVGCESYGRVDMRLGTDGGVMVIEVNPNPDISPGNGAARQAEASGMTYAQFIERIVHLAFERDGHNEGEHTPNDRARQDSHNVHPRDHARVHTSRGGSS